MGLFKKRTDPAEMERIRADIESMSARLAAADAAKQQLDAQVTGLVRRLDTPIAPPPTEPPPAPPPSVDPAEVDKLNAKIERLASRLDDAPSAPVEPAVDRADLDDIRATVERLNARLDEAPAVDPAGAGAVNPEELAEIRSMVERLGARLEEVDGRVTSISTELANQIAELSGELDAAGAHEPPTDQVVDELRDAQARLANEQARYQIAFRQDLADLAERLKRS